MIKFSKMNESLGFRPILTFNQQTQTKDFKINKIESPRFGEYKGKSNLKQNQINNDNKSKSCIIEKGKKHQMIYLKMENHLNKLVYNIFTKIQILHLAQSFFAIKQKSDQKNVKIISKLLKLKIKMSLEVIKRILNKKNRNHLMEGFRKILKKNDIKNKQEQLKLLNRNNKKQGDKIDLKNLYLNDIDKKEGIQLQKKSSKIQKKSNIQHQFSKKYDLKQNENFDNYAALQLENKHLKKQIAKTQRQQDNFMQKMNELLDQYQLPIDDNNTNRPIYLTSFCSSPDNVHNRIKTSNVEKNKIYRDKRY